MHLQFKSTLPYVLTLPAIGCTALQVTSDDDIAKQVYNQEFEASNIQCKQDIFYQKHC